MANPALVQVTGTGSGAPVVVPFTSDVALNNLLVACTRSASVGAISDTQLNDWITGPTVHNTTSNEFYQFFYTWASASGPNTVSWDPSPQSGDLIIAEYSSVPTDAVVNFGTGAQNVSDTIITDTITGVVASDLIISWSGSSAFPSEFVQNTGFTTEFVVITCTLMDKLGATGSVVNNVSQGISIPWGAGIVQFTKATPAATPTFSPVAGTYTGTQHVAISSTTPSASLFYTTDGSTPTSSSTPYTGPVSVASSLTLKAIATASGFADSAVGSAAYTINAPSVYSVPDCRDYGNFPNDSRDVNGTVTYDVQISSNSSVPTPDSRKNKPVASGTYPQNCRTFPPFGE